MLDHPYLPSTWLPYLAIVFNFLGSIAWPTAVAALGFGFRRELSLLVNRVSGLKVGGADVQFSPQSDRPLLEKQSAAELRKLEGIERTPAIERVELQLHKSFETVPSTDRLDLALRLLAQSRLETAYATLHQVIFGSQIDLLEKIRSAGSLDRSEVEDHFQKVQAQWDDLKDETVDLYLHFLFSKELIREIDGKIELTEFGDDYLLFIWRARLTKDRAF